MAPDGTSHEERWREEMERGRKQGGASAVEGEGARLPQRRALRTEATSSWNQLPLDAR